KHDGNVVKLYVHQVPHGCSFYVLNAKKWIPPATIITSQNSSKFSESVKSPLKSSNTEIALWIIIGVVIFILLIVFIGFGYCYYRNEIQKKPHFGKKEEIQQSAFIPESKKAEVVKEKNAGEKEVLKPEPTKEATKEEATAAKEKLPESAKEKTPKEKKAIVETKPTKEVTQENVTKEDVPAAKKKVSAEPTLEDSTTVVQKSVVQQQQPGNLPRVFVPKKAILQAPKSINAPKSESYSSKKDSLSGRHKIGTQIMVVSSLDTLSGAGNDETQNSTRASEKLRKKESSGKGSKKHC
uniref:Uncharacterized protein n=1 Tax=Panagrolaimus sp. PS1159 TaxID=55785 RepID=A0AC35GK92_9BILA